MNSFTTSFLRLGITFGLAATIPAFTDTIFDFELIPENKVLNTAVTIYAPPGGTTGWVTRSRTRMTRMAETISL